MQRKPTRPFNTIFMLSSLDGRISTGDVDARDVDLDIPKIKGAGKWLHQYYELERRTDLHSLNTGRVMAKIGMNRRVRGMAKLPVSFIIIDNRPHLTATGVANMLRKSKVLYLVTTNKRHPAFRSSARNLRMISYRKRIDFTDLFHRLRAEFGVRRITIQSGGTLNSALLRGGLVDRVSIVVAPLLIGGASTPTIMDGSPLRSERDLRKIRRLRLIRLRKLKGSYLHLVYDVLN